MKAAYTALMILGTLIANAADIVDVRNGDFSNGKQFWRGDGKIVTDAGDNKVLELKAGSRESQAITQRVEINVPRVEVTLRARGLDYKGEGLRLSFRRRSGGATFNTKPVTNGSWSDLKWTFIRSTPEEDYTLVITPLMGSGSVQIDDVKVTTGTNPRPQ